MATQKQRAAARKNIKKAQAKWKQMTKRQHSLAQPERPIRQRPGTAGGGKFYRIEVRPKSEFKTFRTHDVGRRGRLERVAGKRTSGRWDTVTWLVEKSLAHVTDKDRLVIDDPKVRTALKQIRGPLYHVKGDVFAAKPRKNVPEREKPTSAMRRARKQNIRKAQIARWGHR